MADRRILFYLAVICVIVAVAIAFVLTVHLPETSATRSLLL